MEQGDGGQFLRPFCVAESLVEDEEVGLRHWLRRRQEDYRTCWSVRLSSNSCTSFRLTSCSSPVSPTPSSTFSGPEERSRLCAHLLLPFRDLADAYNRPAATSRKSPRHSLPRHSSTSEPKLTTRGAVFLATRTSLSASASDWRSRFGLSSSSTRSACACLPCLSLNLTDDHVPLSQPPILRSKRRHGRTREECVDRGDLSQVDGAQRQGANGHQCVRLYVLYG